jgi:ribonuclease HI
MVKQIQGKYKVNSPDLRPLWEEARSRIARLERFEITHALRHKNKAADQLANEAMDRGMKRERSTGEPLPPLRAVPYPAKSSSPPQPGSSGVMPSGVTAARKPDSQMLRGFTRNGTIHLLGGSVLPDGVFVKIIPE